MTVQHLLLAEEFALVAIDDDTGRHARFARIPLDACLAGLLIAELLLDGHARHGEHDDTIFDADTTPPTSSTLAAAAHVVACKGPRIMPIISHINCGLTRQLGCGTWDAACLGLVQAGVMGSTHDRSGRRHDLIDCDRRQAIVSQLRQTAAGDKPLEPRTSLLLSMTGPAGLLNVVAPERVTRRHARVRVAHALDGSPYQPICKTVRQIVTEFVRTGRTYGPA